LNTLKQNNRFKNQQQVDGNNVEECFKNSLDSKSIDNIRGGLNRKKLNIASLKLDTKKANKQMFSNAAVAKYRKVVEKIVNMKSEHASKGSFSSSKPSSKFYSFTGEQANISISSPTYNHEPP